MATMSKVDTSIDVVRRNNVNVFGKGTQSMVFAHGFGCDQNMWRFITPAFQDDYRIVLFDYVGSGNSDLRAYDRARYGTLDGYAEDLLDVCRNGSPTSCSSGRRRDTSTTLITSGDSSVPTSTVCWR